MGPAGEEGGRREVDDLFESVLLRGLSWSPQGVFAFAEGRLPGLVGSAEGVGLLVLRDGTTVLGLRDTEGFPRDCGAAS